MFLFDIFFRSIVLWGHRYFYYIKFSILKVYTMYFVLFYFKVIFVSCPCENTSYIVVFVIFRRNWFRKLYCVYFPILTPLKNKHFI